MKTIIEITGQIRSVSRLCSAVGTYDSEEKIIDPFNCSPVHITFCTRKEAYKALWEGYKYLRANNPNDFMLGYVPKFLLVYDEGNAKILKK